MSLVSTWVKFDDGLFYKNPLHGKKDEWFLCYDDDEDPELVIRGFNGKEFRDPREILDSIGMDDAEIISGPHHSHRCFGRSYACKPAKAYFLKLKSAPPRSSLMKFDGSVGLPKPKGQCCYYDLPIRKV